jgi:hypothetical protein
MSKYHSVQGNVFPVDPGVTDDCTKGFGISFLWYNSVSKSLWFCTEDDPGAATWVKVGQGE